MTLDHWTGGRSSVVLVGLAYYPAKSPSDKTFMRDIARMAESEYGLDIRIVSIAQTKAWTPIPPIDLDERPRVTFVGRPFHPVTEATAGSLAHRSHGLAREYAERTATAMALTPVLRRLRATGGAHYVHFFDNLGPGAGLAARSAGLRAGITLLSSNGRSQTLARRAFWRASCLGVQDVVAGSRDLAHDLVESGVRVSAVIPWAAALRPDRAMEPFTARNRLVWTGRLGSSGAAELELAAVAMAQAAEIQPEMVAEVWPKPEYLREYSVLAEAHGLNVGQPGHAFLDQLERVRVLASPVPGADHVVGPPLTWLEAVSRGCAVVTTPCRGLPPELVESGGIVVSRDRSVDAFREAILGAWRGSGPYPSRVPTVRDAAARYAELWRKAS